MPYTYNPLLDAGLDQTGSGGSATTPGGSNTQIQFNNAGAFGGASTLTYDGSILTTSGRFINSYNATASAPAKAFTGTWFTGGTATTTKPQVLIEPTGTTSTAWSTSGTGLGVNAASGFTGNLLDLQVNGTSQESLGYNGTFAQLNLKSTTSTVYNIAGKGSSLLFYYGSSQANSIALTFGVPGLMMPSNAYIGFADSTDASIGSYDVILQRDAANTLGQRNGTSAQTFRCYGTYTDASNYVRAALSSSSTAVTLAAETAGTGADNVPINLTAAGTGTVKVNSVAEVAVSSTVAGLPTAPAVGMLTRVTNASAPAVGSTVTGGGSAAALVWYNGTNWTVIGV